MQHLIANFGHGFADSGSMMLMLLVFLAAGTLAFALMAFLRVRGSVKRRTARISDEAGSGGRSLRHSSLKAVAHLIEYTTKHYSGTDDATMKVLRQRLVQACVYDPRGVAYFFLARTGLAVVLAIAVFLLLPLVRPTGGSFHWLMAIVGGIAGYIGPSLYLDRRIKARAAEHQSG